jgi:hypothetical protein
MTKAQWADPKYRAEYARKKYASLKKEGLGGRKISYGVLAERVCSVAIARQGVRRMSYW